MTPKEKAEELVNWFLDEGLHSFGRYQSSDIQDLEGSKFCATKVVDEIISIAPEDKSIIGTQYLTIKEFWQQVKQEIEKL